MAHRKRQTDSKRRPGSTGGFSLEVQQTVQALLQQMGESQAVAWDKVELHSGPLPGGWSANLLLVAFVDGRVRWLASLYRGELVVQSPILYDSREAAFFGVGVVAEHFALEERLGYDVPYPSELTA